MPGSLAHLVFPSMACHLRAEKISYLLVVEISELIPKFSHASNENKLTNECDGDIDNRKSYKATSEKSVSKRVAQ